MMEKPLLVEQPDLDRDTLRVVYAQYLRYEKFTDELFDSFSSLQVLTYSASIPMLVKMLNRFDTIECIFGCEKILLDFSDILAAQKVICENLLTVIQGLDDTRKRFLLEKVLQGKARFFVVKDAISHAKIYLLKCDDRRLVLVGSANASERAFSGKQAETLIAFEDELAWNYYQREYDLVKESASSEIALSNLNSTQAELLLEELPLMQEAQQSKTGLTVLINRNVAATTIPIVIRTVEKLADHYRPQIQPLTRPQHGQVHLTREIVGKIVQLVKSQKRTEQTQEPTSLSIFRDTQKVLLSGREISLSPSWTDVQSDVACFIEYFENFRKGFLGDVVQHQKDYFLFLCWFYFSPMICDLRNQAIVEQGYIFDFPLFAVLYGKSNCGKTRLIETVMKSMFGYFSVVEKGYFTRTNLWDLFRSNKRFPVVFDDVEKKRFTDHAMDIIKNETTLQEEYPAYVLSMNAEDHSFSTEIRKRCLILYTRASLPDNTDLAKDLFKSVKSIQRRVSTALYREYLRRVLDRLSNDPLPLDILKFSSEILTAIFRESIVTPLPEWCNAVCMKDYQGRKYEKIQTELLSLYEMNPKIWEIRRQEVILRIPPNESYGLRREIPDWLLKEGSKGGSIVLARKSLEEFLDMSFKRGWWRLFG
jgi:hypothetical protein